jgi:hypothetical protein
LQDLNLFSLSIKLYDTKYHYDGDKYSINRRWVICEGRTYSCFEETSGMFQSEGNLE